MASSSESVGRELDHALEEGERALGERLHLDLLVGRHRLLDQLDARLQVGAVLAHLEDAEALQPLHHEAQRAVREAEHLVDVGERADRVEVALERLVDRRVALGEDADHLALLHGLVDERDGALARHRERQHRLREQQRVAQRQDADLGRRAPVQVDLVNAVRLEVRLALVAQICLLSRGRRCAASTLASSFCSRAKAFASRS